MGVSGGIRGVFMGLGLNYGGFYGILWDLVRITSLLYGIMSILYGIMGVPGGILGVFMGLGWNYEGFYGILWDFVRIKSLLYGIVWDYGQFKWDYGGTD